MRIILIEEILKTNAFCMLNAFLLEWFIAHKMLKSCRSEKRLMCLPSYHQTGFVMTHTFDLFLLWYGWPTKDVLPYFHPGPLLVILIISNLWHSKRRIWTWAEPEFGLCWMKLSRSAKHYIINRALCAQLHQLSQMNYSIDREVILL